MERKIIDGGLQREIGCWGERTFPKGTTASVLAHLEDEIIELGDALDSVNAVVGTGTWASLDGEIQKLGSELADCMFLIMHWCHKQQIVLDVFTPNFEEVWMQETWGDRHLIPSRDLYFDLAYFFEMLQKTGKVIYARYFAWVLHVITEDYDLDLLEEVQKKFEINKARKWGKPDSRGVVTHVKDDSLLHIEDSGYRTPSGQPIYKIA